MNAPSTNGDNGRTAAGRFAPGNAGGPGNPFARRVASLRRAMLDAVSEADMAAIAAALVDKAKAGDVAAVKVLLPYLVGPVAPVVDPDRLDEHEANARQSQIFAGLKLDL